MRKFWIILIGLFFVSGLVLVQTPEENFQEALQTELSARESYLTEKVTEIQKFFDGMSDDAVVSGKGMKTLKKMVKSFDKTKKRDDKELEFYGVATTTDIKSVIREHLKIYFEYSKEDGDPSNFNFRDNKNQDIRRYYVEQKGYDVKVEKSENWGCRVLWGFVVGIVLGFVFCVVILEATNEFGFSVFIGIAVFIIAMICFLGF